VLRGFLGGRETHVAFEYKYPRGALPVDCVVFGWDEKGLKVLLIERDSGPFEGA